jgi:ATP-dependent DNA helicase RecQ
VSALSESALPVPIAEALHRYWGYDALRPLQREAIEAEIAGRDSLVVLPTGGGKSICYQIPPLVDDRLDIVVSPLISLMKDQVDGLRESGYPAAAVHSNLSSAERQAVRAQLRGGDLRLLFVSPERLVGEEFLDFIGRLGVRRFAIDEAHCISQWGHDFRPEYRRLAVLRERFPQATLHAYTATATPRVRQDIVAQLGLRDPEILVGIFDRPNLLYRIQPATDPQRQALAIVQRHRGEAAIVYCLSRHDTESMARFLKDSGVRAAAYHAGLEPTERARVQEAFAQERLEVVAATVAFGMGIDRSDVRCVVHAAMPKSIENYQQETGRAGRDGLEAECVLLFTYADVMKWRRLVEKSAANAPDPEAVAATQLELIRQMAGLCGSAECRHRALSRHFGQAYPLENCGACDVCLGEIDVLPDSTVVAQKILSCVHRVGQRFGVGHLVEVLRGSHARAIVDRGHHELSTHGILRDLPEAALRNLVYQLLDQGLLAQREGEYPLLQLNDASLQVLRGEREVRLLAPAASRVSQTSRGSAEWAGVDRELFDRLRDLRREISAARGVPAYTIFSDGTLREMARSRPTTTEAMGRIAGVGARKLVQLAPRFADAIAEHCTARGLASDLEPLRPRAAPRPNPRKEAAMALFREGRSLAEVVAETGRAPSTIAGYLEEFIARERPASLAPWVDEATFEQVISAAAVVGSQLLAPIHEHLGGRVPFEQIRIALAQWRLEEPEE